MPELSFFIGSGNSMAILKTSELEADILVAGGGPAGVCAALAAARNGAKVILCQDRPVLGGNASSEIRMHIVGANGTGKSERGEELVTEAREGGIIEEIRLENAVHNPQRSSSMFDLILYDKCRTEPNLTLMLNTTIVGARVVNGRIVAVLGIRQSTEEEFLIRAKRYIDCTGDGRLGVEAGAPFMEGREDKAAYGESLAQETADNLRLGSTILIQARKHDRPMPYVAPSWVREFTKEELKLRLYAVPGDEEPTHEYGYWWAEWGELAIRFATMKKSATNCSRSRSESGTTSRMGLLEQNRARSFQCSALGTGVVWVRSRQTRESPIHRTACTHAAGYPELGPLL
ncbi:MAG: FAD-dependent oxidoreductase [Planctomycetaceae bacterium]